MDLRATILAEHTKAQRDRIVKWVGLSQQRFDELLRLFLHDEWRVTQRAAWPLSYAAGKHPALVQKHIGKLIKNLQRPGITDAVKRNTVRILEKVDIPTRYHGEILNTCFQFIESHEEPVAVKAFSLTILENLLPAYPDIKQELKLIIEERWPHEKPAFHSRARRVLEKL